MSEIGSKLGAQRKASQTNVPGRMIAVVDRRQLVRDCIHKSLNTLLDEEIVSFPTLDLVSSWLDGDSAECPEMLILYSIGNRFLDSRATGGMARILSLGGRIRVAIVSEREDIEMATAAIEHGACGFLPFAMSLLLLAEAVLLLQAGGLYIPASVVLAANHKQVGGEAQSSCGVSGLTARQLAVLDAVRRGKPNKLIAYDLNMCESTVKVHIRNIMRKLHARNRTEAAYMALEPDE